MQTTPFRQFPTPASNPHSSPCWSRCDGRGCKKCSLRKKTSKITACLMGKMYFRTATVLHRKGQRRRHACVPGFVPFLRNNFPGLFQDFSRTQIDFSRTQKFILKFHSKDLNINFPYCPPNLCDVSSKNLVLK